MKDTIVNCVTLLQELDRRLETLDYDVLNTPLESVKKNLLLKANSVDEIPNFSSFEELHKFALNNHE